MEKSPTDYEVGYEQDDDAKTYKLDEPCTNLTTLTKNRCQSKEL
mgnify:CR=1 FL=1